MTFLQIPLVIAQADGTVLFGNEAAEARGFPTGAGRLVWEGFDAVTQRAFFSRRARSGVFSLHGRGEQTLLFSDILALDDRTLTVLTGEIPDGDYEGEYPMRFYTKCWGSQQIELKICKKREHI